MENKITRKERRLSEKKRQNFRLMKKSAALVGTSLSACALVAPLMKPQLVEATQYVAGRSTNTSAYIAELAAHAQGVASRNDLYASVMIAQAIVESGWGSSSLSNSPYHNLFGIKGSYNGQTVYMNTLEYLNSQWVTMKEPFKKYPSYAESFADNAATLRNVVIGGQHYYRGAWKSNTSSYRDATAWLTGRYATAPNYASALNTIIDTYGLTKYDSPASGSQGGGASTGSSSNTGNTTTNTGSTYKVLHGDSVWLIANKFGITMDQLRQWNNIQNNFIYPGQVLTVKGTSQGTSNGQTTPVEKVPTTPPATSDKYTVQSGDSVWGVATKYGLTMEQLVRWNGIQNNFIYPGQQLTVKEPAGTSTPPASNTTGTGNESASDTYTVKNGDSVWGIAEAHGITMAQLVDWNGIQNNFVYAGQKLTVRNGGTNQQAATPATPSNNGQASGTTTNKYTVKNGDSVWLVANKHGITMEQLISWNQIKNNFIYPGLELLVKEAPKETATKYYVVASGESVWSIADKHGITMEQLIQWNGIENNFIYPGQKLIVEK